ncbi:MAG: hypothetical protein Q8O67_17395 [Deltaproteobacteria bacterium]|nr:hypothetical protein [Deltaproteobacteria bacterium]
MNFLLRTAAVVTVAVAATCLACVAAGDERGACLPDDTCNGDLTCLSGSCVDAGEPPPSAKELAEAFDRFFKDCLGLGRNDELARVEPARVDGAELQRESVEKSFANPELTLNEAAYARCLDVLLTCDLSGVGKPGSCLNVFDGSRALGAGCGGVEQFDLCVPALVCDSVASDEACGTCVARPAIGEACVGERGCATDALCVENPARVFTCVALLPPGAPCGGNPDLCGEGTSCGADGNGNAICGAPLRQPPLPPAPEVGDPCDEVSCGGSLSGLACVDSRCALVTPVQPGGACDVPFRAEVVNYCVNQLAGDNVCVPTDDFGTVGVCTAIPSTGPCADGQCAAGAVCDDVDECVAPPGGGQSCISRTCASGFGCDTSVDVDGVCAALPGVDEPCLAGRCADGLRCNSLTVTCGPDVDLICPA